ncbi:hypothetical protein J5N97_000981 [Dioscorea zingiberensis]|uniref:Uncharacterized protein n=1 Tax=Dioscorea zingiberensis TaxID=325984 RepID=A0A9D5H2J3_9LILI|nr:hypothetical protein J5N97_000981 [Dioscorea zingiberensis]
MGNSLSSDLQKKQSKRRLASAAALVVKVIYPDGRMEEYYRESLTAEKALEGSSGCCVCSAEEMRLAARPPTLSDGEELRRGQLYFVLPAAATRRPLTLPDLCRLAVMADAAMRRSNLRELAGRRRRNGVVC